MKKLFFALFLLLPSLSFANSLEDLLPSNHPSRKLTLSLVFSKLQQSSRDWMRNGFYEERGECLHWLHNEDQLTTTCLKKNERTYILSVKSDSLKEVFEFEFSRDVSFTIFDIMSFDANLFQSILVKFKAQNKGFLYEVNQDVVHFKTISFGIYEFFSVLTPWADGGVRQEVFGRCLTCSGKHYRAFIDSSGDIEYRASDLAGRLMPGSWNEFLGFSYFFVLEKIASTINIFN